MRNILDVVSRETLLKLCDFFEQEYKETDPKESWFCKGDMRLIAVETIKEYLGDIKRPKVG